MKKRNAQWLSGNEASTMRIVLSFYFPPFPFHPRFSFFFPSFLRFPLFFPFFFHLFSFFSSPLPAFLFSPCFLMGKSKGVPRCRGNTCNLCVGNGKNMVKGHVRRWTLKTIRILISVVKYGPGHYQPRMYLSLAPIYRQDLANIDAFPVYFFFFPPPLFFLLSRSRRI